MTWAHGKNFVTKSHKAAYPAISPLRPQESQQGRVVLVTGGSAGIGFAIAKGFATASAATVIIAGRRETQLASSLTALEAEFPNTKFLACQLDIADEASIEALFAWLADKNIVLDVLVLNAAQIGVEATELDQGHRQIWSDFVSNVRSYAIFADLFYHQAKHDPNKKLALINVSTGAIHDFEISGSRPNYSASKNAAAILLQQVAKDVSSSKMQIVSFHPGAIYTDAAKGADWAADFDWDNASLPGEFAVWAASDEAAFLHGRFVWASWDVDELRSGQIRERLDSDPNYLKVGVVGL